MEKKDGIPEFKVTPIRFPKLQVRRQTIFQFFLVMGHLTKNSKDAIHISGPVLSAMADTICSKRKSSVELVVRRYSTGSTEQGKA